VGIQCEASIFEPCRARAPCVLGVATLSTPRAPYHPTQPTPHDTTRTPSPRSLIFRPAAWGTEQRAHAAPIRSAPSSDAAARPRCSPPSAHSQTSVRARRAAMLCAADSCACRVNERSRPTPAEAPPHEATACSAKTMRSCHRRRRHGDYATDDRPPAKWRGKTLTSSDRDQRALSLC